MTWVLKQGMISKHPFKDDAHSIASYHLKISERTPTVLTTDEIKAMMEALKDNPHGLTVFLGYLLTGMRKGELTESTWDMVVALSLKTLHHPQDRQAKGNTRAYELP